MKRERQPEANQCPSKAEFETQTCQFKRRIFKESEGKCRKGKKRGKKKTEKQKKIEKKKVKKLNQEEL